MATINACKKWGMPCANCGQTINEHGGDWPGLNGPICHPCWEIEADNAWWDAVRTMDAALALVKGEATDGD